MRLSSWATSLLLVSLLLGVASSSHLELGVRVSNQLTVALDLMIIYLHIKVVNIETPDDHNVIVGFTVSSKLVLEALSVGLVSR